MADEGMKVLVVDDEEGILDFMQKILAFRGFKPLGTMDGEEAVAIFEREHPPIAVIDVQLTDSKIDGLEVLSHIKKAAPSTICFMVTRITEPEAIDRAKALGADHYLLKPLDTKEWLAEIMKAQQAVLARS